MTERTLRAYQAVLHTPEGQTVLYDLHAYVSGLPHEDRAGAALVTERMEKYRNPEIGKALGNGRGRQAPRAAS